MPSPGRLKICPAEPQGCNQRKDGRLFCARTLVCPTYNNSMLPMLGLYWAWTIGFYSAVAFATGASWLGSNRPDFVTNTDPTDQNFVSTGWGTLFINYLRFQKDTGLKPAAQAWA